MHAALWATRYLDITGCDVNAMEGPPSSRPAGPGSGTTGSGRGSPRTSPTTGSPAACFARPLATARCPRLGPSRSRANAKAPGRGETDYANKPGLDFFWRRLVNGEASPVEPLAERVATTFLGIRIECAQCHKHPFDRWTQADYRSFANIVADVRFGLRPDSLAAVAALLDERRKADPKGALPPIPRLREVYLSPRSSRRLADPDTGRPLAPRALGGPELPDDGDLRERLFGWLTAPDNPYFARSFVNRVWAVYFGAGLVDPVDGFSVTNPPSNPRLLDALAADFVAHGYDIRRLERLILNSRAYRRSSQPVAGNLDDRGNFARSMPRPLMAEVLVDAINAALDVPGDFGPDAPKGSRAIEIATNRVASPDLARAFRAFGRPERAAVCDCERPKAPALPQTLFLMTDDALLARLKSGRVADAGRVGPLRRGGGRGTLPRRPVSPPVLGRGPVGTRPSPDEPDRASGLADVLWALINTREFVLNH